MVEFAEFSLRAKSKYRTVCAVKDCTSNLEKNLDVICYDFPTLKRFELLNMR